ncbi:hypothetical protein Patl1_27489 [Pistacia atlantica]|uniref:Uncharacterized protein n=1 Tax=Pistacia atlantica TaxID=434234 RepID=A0ACC1BEZ2_9ROSI|nr:hypothetical protein Patl1_27489 [Pistacia atlantica]
MPPVAMDYTTPALGACRALIEPMASFSVEETSLLIYAKFVSRSIFSDMEEDPPVYLGNQNNVIHPNVNFTTFTRLYGLVQCTLDIVSSECRICLAACMSEIRKCCNGKEEGRVSKPSCNMRIVIFICI